MFYVVDQHNRIVDVGPDWDEFSNRNGGGAHNTRDRVIGRPIEAFMAGDATKMFVRAALDSARLLGESRALPYRCDSPTERRRFEMVVSPCSLDGTQGSAGGGVRVEHRLLSCEARPPQRIGVAGSRVSAAAAAASGWRCSQCLAVCLRGSSEWSHPDMPGPLPLAQDVCPRCASALFGDWAHAAAPVAAPAAAPVAATAAAPTRA